MEDIHEHNNGVLIYKNSLYTKGQLERYKIINLHEPFEDCVFDHIFKNSEVTDFIDIGSAWGYYTILAKKKNPNVNILSVDTNKKIAEKFFKNLKLNNIESGIELVNKSIPDEFNLNEYIKGKKKISLIKIDIQGYAFGILDSIKDSISQVEEIIIGTHSIMKEHDTCENFLKDHGFEIKLSLRGKEIPIQPDGLLWGRR